MAVVLAARDSCSLAIWLLNWTLRRRLQSHCRSQLVRFSSLQLREERRDETGIATGLQQLNIYHPGLDSCRPCHVEAWRLTGFLRASHTLDTDEQRRQLGEGVPAVRI